MKLQGPKGTTGASVGGQFFQANKRGVITVPDDGEYASTLAPHGFAPIGSAEDQETEQVAEVADDSAEQPAD